MNKDYSREGDQMVKKAQKSLKGGFLKNLLTSKEERFDQALDYYEKSINYFKLDKNWQKCAEINLECANLAWILGNKKQQAQFLSDSGNF